MNFWDTVVCPNSPNTLEKKVPKTFGLGKSSKGGGSYPKSNVSRNFLLLFVLEKFLLRGGSHPNPNFFRNLSLSKIR